MEITENEAQLRVVNLIRDLLVEIANDGASAEELEEMKDHFGQIAEAITLDLGLTIQRVEDGAAIASLSPLKGWI